MKRFITLSLLLVTVSFSITTSLKAQSLTEKLKKNKMCYVDAYGYTYQFDLKPTGERTAYGTGTESGGTLPVPWPAEIWLDFTNGFTKGIVEIHVTNPRPNNCGTFVDSFHESGRASVSRDDTYILGGTWINYCYGSILGSGVWSGNGPCHQVNAKPEAKDMGPNFGKADLTEKSAPKNPVSISPNPVNNFALFKFTLKTAASVNITLYNSMQQPIKVLVNEKKPAGNYSVSWNTFNSKGVRVSNGIYRVVTVIDNVQYSSILQVLR